MCTTRVPGASRAQKRYIRSSGTGVIQKVVSSPAGAGNQTSVLCKNKQQARRTAGAFPQSLSVGLSASYRLELPRE